MSERQLNRWILGGAVFAVILFVAAIGFMGWRDHRATARCESLGGVTWDSGQHCVIGPDRIVDTHNRRWG